MRAGPALAACAACIVAGAACVHLPHSLPALEAAGFATLAVGTLGSLALAVIHAHNSTDL